MLNQAWPAIYGMYKNRLSLLYSLVVMEKLSGLLHKLPVLQKNICLAMKIRQMTTNLPTYNCILYRLTGPSHRTYIDSVKNNTPESKAQNYNVSWERG